ncbi:MAG: TonB-dependent siderophore receptor [Polaromonas sp.]|nr:TonB-dependent siderophore receptor [Polaromonas sp.]
MLAASVSGWAQTPPSTDKTLPTVTVTEQADGSPVSKTTLRAKETSIGKGTQALRDIPQSVTVMTEQLLQDRNLDDFREVLRTTAGVTFQAGETGEEDVRMRGFSLGQAGDIYTDGLRDGALYERDTFNNDRVEVLKGSASMLFGKGSTGGLVNQVNKQPFLLDQQEVNYSFGTGQNHRLTGDFNIVTGENAALRLNALVQEADNYGAKISKRGIAPTFRWGIGTRNEFSVGLYHLESEGRPIYNHPWFVQGGKIKPTLPARNYYGFDSDYLDTSATYVTASHVYRFDDGAKLQTRVRHGRYERDLWASVIRFAGGTTAANLNDNTVISRTPKGRIGVSDTTQLQSDYSGTFNWFGKKNEILTGVDIYDEDAKRINNFAGPGSPLTTTVGNPDPGQSRPDLRGTPAFNRFDARNIGLYVQDMLSLTPEFKLLGGIRYDNFKASYVSSAGVKFDKSADLWSPRVGAIYQPNDVSSYYASFGTSFNVSGDTYQFAVGAPNLKDANTGPEKSRNFEVGSKFELFENSTSLGIALFRSEKYNERNTDPDFAAQQQLLSGKRHATGMEFNVAGRIDPKWDVFYNHTWIPSAKIDKSNVAFSTGGAQIQGDRPALTPKHSASLFTTYRVLPALRIGGGLTYRGEQNPEGSRATKAKSFTTFDAMAEYTVSDMTSVKLNVSNLTDERYADSLYRGFYVPGAARAVTLSVKVLF